MSKVSFTPFPSETRCLVRPSSSMRSTPPQALRAEVRLQFFVQLNQGPDQGVRATLGEIDAPFSLKKVNQRVDGGGLEGFATSREWKLKACPWAVVLTFATVL